MYTNNSSTNLNQQCGNTEIHNIIDIAKNKIKPIETSLQNEQLRESQQKSPGLPKYQLIEKKSMPINNIIVNQEVQQRMATSENTVREYTTALKNGKQFPPVVIFMDHVTEQEEPKYYLADGFHRISAYQRLEKTEIECEIYKGSIIQATIYAAGCNTTHGLKRSNKDKKKAVITLLSDSTWNRLTDNEIARHCHVSQPFVSKLRSKIKNDLSYVTKRIDKNGRFVETEKIGNSKKTQEKHLINTSFMQEVKPDQYDPIGISVLKMIQNFYTKINEKPKDRIFLLTTIQEHLEACRSLLPQEELVEV